MARAAYAQPGGLAAVDGLESLLDQPVHEDHRDAVLLQHDGRAAGPAVRGDGLGEMGQITPVGRLGACLARRPLSSVVIVILALDATETRVILFPACNLRFVAGLAADGSPPKPCWGPPEIAAHLGVNPHTVNKWVARKQLPAHNVGGLWKF